MMTSIKLSDICIDGDIQPRAQIDWIIVSEYAEAMKAGDTFPPVVVFCDGSTNWLADGFHRVAAARDYAELTEFPADVRQGSKRDAAWFALGANKGHGLRLKQGDYERILTRVFTDEEWREKGLRETARHTGIPIVTVHRWHERLSVPMEQIEKPAVRKVTRNGTTYAMDTTNIGKPTEPEPEPPSFFDDDLEQEESNEWIWTYSPEDGPAYCKYCYTVHADWEVGGDYDEPVWECKHCDHATADRFMDQRDFSELEELQDVVDIEEAETENAGVEPEPFGLDELQKVVKPTIRIVNVDAQYLSQYIDQPVQLVVTSPPYNVGIDYEYHNDDLLTYIPLITAVWRQCFDVMADGARIAVVVPFGVGRNPWVPLAYKIMDTLTDVGFTLRGQIIWDKNTSGNRTSWGSFRLPSDPSLRDTTEAIIVAHKGGSKLDIPDEAKRKDAKGTYSPWLVDSDYFMELAQDHWIVAPESAQRVKHPAPFPVELVKRLLHFYAYPGAHVLDPFAGSGTTGIACKELGCDATLFELDATYCELAEKRING